ncbi:hypothetical protein C347_06473 [Cryptococcus neoformans AD2-60a]|nr:hypothetical protein C347_06473 [Cryptococcus neoformans var. grubii AD2-60a]
MTTIERTVTTTTSKKRPLSCDLCRRRKVKCNKPPLATRCEGCVVLNQECEYKYQRRRPGPVNRYTTEPFTATSDNRPQLVEASSSSPQPSQVSHDHSMTPSPSCPRPSGLCNVSGRQYTSHSPRRASIFQSQSEPPPQSPAPLDMTLPRSSGPHCPSLATTTPDCALPSTRPAHMGLGLGSWVVDARRQNTDSATDWSWLPISSNALFHAGIGESTTASEPSSHGWSWDHNLIEPHAIEFASLAPDVTGMAGQSSGLGLMPRDDTDRTRLPSASALLSSASPGSVRHTGIEEWIPWGTLMRILHAYHTHLYPLLPVMHWPTFLQLLMSREDERSQTWRAYLLSLVAYSIIQLPRSALSFLEVPTFRHLHRRCHAASVALQNCSYKVVTVTDIATLYCDHIYLSTLGSTTAANVALAKAIRLAQELKLHDEGSAGVNTDRIELEVRRRLFWLLYGSDRTITALTSAPFQIVDADVRVSWPSEVDDNLITASGAFPQPSGVYSVLCGFHHVSRIFHLLGAVITAHRSLLAKESSIQLDPSLPSMWPAIRPTSHFRNALQRILDNLPPPLQLASPLDPPLGGKRNEPPRLRHHGIGVFETCKANLLVSQAMVRFAIRQYAVAVGEREDELNDKAWVKKYVLSMLETYALSMSRWLRDADERANRMPSESLAVNGESLRNKVIFFASNLIDKYAGITEEHTYISDLLAVYTRIREEQQSSLLESVESVMPSRAPTPRRL